MSKKVQLRFLINNELVEINPRTSADNVIMNDGSSVEATIAALTLTVSGLSTDLAQLKDKLFLDTVYMTDGSGNILNDGSGTNLVAVY